MRLIDADALKDHLQSLAYDDWNQGVCTSWADAYRECADMVDEQPTIEPERKPGKWIKEENRGQLYRCSACGNFLDFRGVNAGRGSANYCPNCGADMREGAEQDVSDT